MITIEYSPEGIAVADHEAEEFVRNLVTECDVNNVCSANVSTENVITIARVLKRRIGLEVQFKFKDEILVPDKDGRMEYWPDGFSDFWDKCLLQLF